MKTVVLGAGLGGLSTALALAPRPVVLVSPCPLGEGCSSAWAQGGIAAALDEDDKAEFHAKDTMAVGAELNDASIVRQTTEDAAQVIERLTRYGVSFDRDSRGHLLFGLEAAHGKKRIVHVKDGTGLAVMQALIKAARKTPSIEIIENTLATDLVVEDNAVTGVVLNQKGKSLFLETNAVVLATGGADALWRDTTTPHQNWGGGLALAARAGATLGDLEFLQFHPTAIDIGRDPMPLASEALRGEGSILINETGSRFTEELQARDIVARAIWKHIEAGHRVFLDARKALGKEFAHRFPNIHAICMSANIDPATQPIPVRPAAHYHMGGVVTDARGRTDVHGLWACGEVACTGLHGANRLASNSLLEAASFGQRVADDIKGLGNFGSKKALVAALKTHEPASQQNMPIAVQELAYQKTRRDSPPPAGGVRGGVCQTSCEARSYSHSQRFIHKEYREIIRAAMSDHVGVIRNGEGLKRAVDMLAPLAQKSDMALAGLMIALCAMRRKESRGAHYRSDFPQTDPNGSRSRLKLSELEDFLCH